jgi:hypothetical protein
MSGASSQESAAWTADSPSPDTSTSSSARSTSGAEMSSPPAGPECPSTPMSETLAPKRQASRSTSSAEASPAKTSPSQDDGPASPATAPDSSMSTHESLSLFDPDGFSSRTFPASSPHTAVGTSESSLARWPTSGTAWAGGFSTHVSSECRSADGECSSSEPALTEILEPPQDVHPKYSLSARAALGILRRAEKRGRALPPHLLSALSEVAASAPDGASDQTKQQPDS